MNEIIKLLKNSINQGIEKFKKTSNDLEDKIIPMTIRVPNDLKYFYECIAEAESTSLQSAIIGTLKLTKDSSIKNFDEKYSLINSSYEYQLNQFFNVLQTHRFDVNDIESLLHFITGKKIIRQKLIEREYLYSLLDKRAIESIATLFEYNYKWFLDGSCDIHISKGFNDRWYKNTTPFLSSIIKNYVTDPNNENVELHFVFNDEFLVKNILEERSVKFEYTLVPVVKAKRNINGVLITTYHKMESGSIDYFKCRKHFVELLKQVYTLNESNILGEPKGYFVETKELDPILSGEQHISSLLSKIGYRHETMNFREITNMSVNKPTSYHILSTSFLEDLIEIPSLKKLSYLNIETVCPDLNIISINDDLVKFLRKQSYRGDWIKSPESIKRYLMCYITTMLRTSTTSKKLKDIESQMFTDIELFKVKISNIKVLVEHIKELRKSNTMDLSFG